MTAKALSFDAVDDLGFAGAAGHIERAQQAASFAPTSLGPLLELVQLSSGNRLPPLWKAWTASNGAGPMLTALHENREMWLSPDNRRMGFIRTKRTGADADHPLVSFLIDAQRAARDVAGLPRAIAGQLTAAMQELESNIHEHSGAVGTGLLAYRAARGVFEFVAADCGIGILSSLKKCPLYSALRDHGKALQQALEEGVSRFGLGSDRGYGFRPIFVGLMNLYGFLRFRTGDHALIMDGTSPMLAKARLAQKPPIDGFFASIRCHRDHSG
ncbi:MAG TPA: hypothetical protein VIY49_26175 [Bryobacteraceae bacterium]